MEKLVTIKYCVKRTIYDEDMDIVDSPKYDTICYTIDITKPHNKQCSDYLDSKNITHYGLECIIN